MLNHNDIVYFYLRKCRYVFITYYYISGVLYFIYFVLSCGNVGFY